MGTLHSPAKRATGKARSTARHPVAVKPVDEHLRLKISKINAERMDAAVQQLGAGKGVEWNPFKK
jgi:hypothetical protein